MSQEYLYSRKAPEISYGARPYLQICLGGGGGGGGKNNPVSVGRVLSKATGGKDGHGSIGGLSSTALATDQHDSFS